MFLEGGEIVVGNMDMDLCRIILREPATGSPEISISGGERPIVPDTPEIVKSASQSRWAPIEPIDVDSLRDTALALDI